MGLTRCYATQIRSETGVEIDTANPAFDMALQYASFVLTRFTVRPDGRTPFEAAVGGRYSSPLCCFGESIFALIPDTEI